MVPQGVRRQGGDLAVLAVGEEARRGIGQLAIGAQLELSAGDVAGAAQVPGAERLYWIQTPANVVETCRISQCAASRRTLPMSEPDPLALDIDGQAIYLATRTFVPVEAGSLAAGKVWRLAK